MKELDDNKLPAFIKLALEKKGGNLEGYFNRILLSSAIKNMQKIAIGEETQASDYRLFFEGFKGFLDKELLNKELLAQLYQEEKNVNRENEDITFDLKGLEEKITEKKENEIYLKILTLLANSRFEKLTVSKVSQIFNVLEFFLNKSDFFQAADFSTKMDAIYYSLTHAESFETAKMLVRLSDFDLLTEGNLKKINANPQLNIKLFSNVLNKLNLSGGTDSLLTQANLDKLLQKGLNLEMLAKFIQAEDKSKILTQENFDLAINLKNLLTHENITKIEKAAFDPAKLSDVFLALNESKILTQDNFDQLIDLNKVDFEKIVPVLENLNKNKILNQDNFYEFLNTFLATRIYDEQAKEFDHANGQQDSKTSLTDKFCKMLKESWLGRNAQVIFNKIIAAFNKMTKRYETQDASATSDETATAGRNPNSFFASSCSRFENVTDTEASRANISNTCGVK